MDVRDSANPVVLAAARRLALLNARHPWNHNEHFHGWILRSLPARRQLAVDVGCGTGVLTARLADRFAQVTGIDADPGMAAAAGTRLAGNPRVTIRRCGFGQFAAETEPGQADLITMVAVLHHLSLREALEQIPPLLAPGGRLLVVGLARVDSPADAAVDLVSAVANPVMGLVKHHRAVTAQASRADGAGQTGQPVMPRPRPGRDVCRDCRDGPRLPARRGAPPPAVLPLHAALGKAALTAAADGPPRRLHDLCALSPRGRPSSGHESTPTAPR